MFRAHGLLAPVWDLPVGTGAEVLEEPAANFKATLDEALDDTSDLTTEQRAARSGPRTVRSLSLIQRRRVQARVALHRETAEPRQGVC